INPTRLPLALVQGRCVPVYPHDFIKVNTIFEVIRAHNGRTAWSDKHPAYDLVNGPSGRGVQDLFTPEVNSNDPVTGQDTTTGFHSVQRNDMLKVTSILNEIAGFDSTGTRKVGVPTIFGMNFQAVSVGQKLAKGNKNDPLDAGLIGGYADALGAKPNNGLQNGLNFVDARSAPWFPHCRLRVLNSPLSSLSQPNMVNRRSIWPNVERLMTALMGIRPASQKLRPTMWGSCGSRRRCKKQAMPQRGTI